MRYELPYHPIESTSPSFRSTLGSSAIYALESTADLRSWVGPTSRAIRVAGIATTPYYLMFGSSTVVPSTNVGMLVPSGGAEVFAVPAGVTYIGIASSTDVAVNITLGYGAR